MIAIDTDSVRDILEDARDEVLSLYVRVGGEASWREWIERAVSKLEEDISSDRSARSRWLATVNRLEGFLAGYVPSGKTLVSFVTPDGHRFAELPVLLEQEGGYGKPRMHQLLKAIDEYRHYLVALVTSDGIRLVSGYLGYGHSDGRARLALDDRWEIPWAAHTARQEGTGHVYRKALARELGSLASTHPGLDRLVLGGDVAEAHEVRKLAHPGVAAAVAGILPIPPDLDDEDVLEQVERRLAIPFERQRELDIVERMVRLTSEGSASTDAGEVGSALDRHRVRTLVLACPESNAELTEPLLRRAFASSSTVELVHGPAADRLRERGGVAAELYFGI